MSKPLSKEELRLARLQKLDPSSSSTSTPSASSTGSGKTSSSCCTDSCSGKDTGSQSSKANNNHATSKSSAVKGNNLQFGARIASLPKNCNQSRWG